MSNRTRYLGLCAVLLCSTLAGCVAPYTYYCEDGCGDLGPTAPYNELSGRYSDGCATPCAPCEARAVACPPAAHSLTGLLRGMVTCNAGCGDVYWGEWTYDPPDDCDPCNNHGDWIGPRCCPPGGWLTLWQGLQGGRVGGCDSGGCADHALADGSILEEPMDESFISPAVPDELPPTAPIESDGNSADSGGTAMLPYYSRDPNSRLIRRTRR